MSFLDNPNFYQESIKVALPLYGVVVGQREVLRKFMQESHSEEPRFTGHIFAAVLVGFLGSSTGNSVLLVMTRDLLEIDLLIPTSLNATSLVVLNFTHIYISSALGALLAGFTMCYLCSKTKRPDIILLTISSTCFFLSCWWPLSLPITVTFAAKVVLFIMHFLSFVAITAPVLRARECALRQFMTIEPSKASQAGAAQS